MLRFGHQIPPWGSSLKGIPRQVCNFIKLSEGHNLEKRKNFAAYTCIVETFKSLNSISVKTPSLPLQTLASNSAFRWSGKRVFQNEDSRRKIKFLVQASQNWSYWKASPSFGVLPDLCYLLLSELYVLTWLFGAKIGYQVRVEKSNLLYDEAQSSWTRSMHTDLNFILTIC